MSIFSRTLLGIAMLLPALCLAGPNPLWMRYPAISPDGQFVVFSYQGDLYKVAASGGQAFPLTLHEYREHSLGKIIGMPIPGTGTAVWWEAQIDPTLVFGIPQVGMVALDGKYLENTQLEPDVKGLEPARTRRQRPRLATGEGRRRTPPGSTAESAYDWESVGE